MQDKKHMFMIFGVVVIVVALIYIVFWPTSPNKCTREGLENNFASEVLSVIESNNSGQPASSGQPTSSGQPANNFASEVLDVIESGKSGETTTPDNQLDNYNYFTKNSIPTVYYGPDNSTARVTVLGGENDESNSSETEYGITITNANGATVTYVMEKSSSSPAVNPLTNMPDTTGNSNTVINPLTNMPVSTSTASQDPVVPSSIANTRFVDQDGNVAKLYVASNGQYVVQTRQIDGNDKVYTSTNVFTYDRNNSKSFLVGDTVNDITPISEVQNTTDNLINSLTSNTLSSSQAQTVNGIPGRMIPPGQEDLYILKSQIVPPVCPRCPTICASKSSSESCPPCPSCARCPESTDFTCKKVPDYTNNTVTGSIIDVPGTTGTYNSSVSNNGSGMWGPSSSSSISSPNGANGSAPNYNQYRNNTQFTPVPVVSNFSTFGM